MKTILILIAGMGDIPDPVARRNTPLSVSSVPSLNMLARRGEQFNLTPLPSGEHYNHVNAMLAILGYDLERGVPKVEELREFGLDGTSVITDFPTLHPFIIPGFSGHGVTVTTSAWARGAGKCAILNPVDIYSPGSSEAEILETMAYQTCKEIIVKEFVFVYVDSPLKASLKGDYEAKIRALETIDRHLIAPIADFVWKSELLIQLAVTTDLITPCHSRKCPRINVPGILYFNQNDCEGIPDSKFTETGVLVLENKFSSPSDLIRYLSNFYVPGEDNYHDLPF